MPDFKVAPTVNGVGLVRVNGADPLTANWDIGEDRRILAEAFRARDVEGMRLEDDAGNLGILIEDNGLVVIGNNGTQFRNSNVAHGMTDFVSTDTYGQVIPGMGFIGGLSIQGFTDADGIPPLGFAAYFGADPTDASPAIQFIAQKKSGTNAVALAATETVMTIDNGATVMLTITGNGRINVLGGVRALSSAGIPFYDDGGNQAMLVADGGVLEVGNTTNIDAIFRPSSGTNVASFIRIIPRGAPTAANGRGVLQFFNTDFVADATNYDYGQFGFVSDYLDLLSAKGGTGTIRSIRLRTSGNDNQVILKTTGQTGFNAPVANIDSIVYIEGNTTDLLHVHNTGSGATAADFSSIYFSNPNQKWSFNVGAHGNATWADKFYIHNNTSASVAAIWDLLGKMGVGGLTAPAAQLHVDQASTTAAVPVLLLDQADLSEEFIEFTATVGAGNPIDTAAIGTYYGKIRVNVTGVGYKYIALYNT